jgi:hypothetical protein
MATIVERMATGPHSIDRDVLDNTLPSFYVPNLPPHHRLCVMEAARAAQRSIGFVNHLHFAVRTAASCSKPITEEVCAGAISITDQNGALLLSMGTLQKLADCSIERLASHDGSVETHSEDLR